MPHVSTHKLNEAQLNMLKSLMFLNDEKEIQEIDSLINFYLEMKLDEAIERVEHEKGYSATIYEQWLADNNKGH
jgi:hypothetical protein